MPRKTASTSPGGQIAQRGIFNSNAPEIEILIAVPVLQEQHMRVRAGKPVGEDRPFGLAGQGASFGEIGARRRPHVHYAVDVAEPGEPESVGRDARAESVGKKNVRRAITGMLLSLAMLILRGASLLWIRTVGTATTCASRTLCQTSARNNPDRPGGFHFDASLLL
jgi:hypothetical protein